MGTVNKQREQEQVQKFHGKRDDRASEAFMEVTGGGEENRAHTKHDLAAEVRQRWSVA